MKGYYIVESEIMVSFDIESLFMHVPIKGAVQAALRKLEADSCLSNSTTLTPTQIADLLDFILRSTYFQYDGLIYEQQEGAAMGTWRILKNKLWLQRLVCLRFGNAMWMTPLSQVVTKSTFSYNNSIVQQPTIRFTMETETIYLYCYSISQHHRLMKTSSIAVKTSRSTSKWLNHETND